MNEEKQIYRNFIWTLLSRGGVALLLLVNLLLSARYLGSEVVGQLSILVLNIALIHSVAEVYTGSALVYFIPSSPLRTIYSQGLLWCVITALVLSGLFSLFQMSAANMFPHLVLLSLFTSLNAFHQYILLGRRKFRLFNLLMFLQPAFSVLALLICIVGLGWRDFSAPLLALYISNALSLMISAVAVRRTVNECRQNGEIPFLRVIANGSMNEVGNLAHTLSNRFNYFVLKGFSLAMVGVYANSTSLIESVLIISSGASSLIQVRVATGEDPGTDRKATLRMAYLSLLLTFICVVVLFFIPADFFTQLLGRDFSEVKKVMILLSPGVIALSFSSVLSHYFSGKGMQSLLLRANLCGLLISLCCAYILIHRFGLTGACMTASAAYLMQALVITWFFVRDKSPATTDLNK